MSGETKNQMLRRLERRHEHLAKRAANAGAESSDATHFDKAEAVALRWAIDTLSAQPAAPVDAEREAEEWVRENVHTRLLPNCAGKLGFLAGAATREPLVALLKQISAAAKKQDCECGFETGSEEAHREAICFRCETIDRIEAALKEDK